ncbi:MAG: tRNA (adenosine(37)-N6)-threonylcarbamoyltransferase complex dimerization subunit type 1 TsaB [Tenericutes bacterium GWC2_34_14]|nr:MAG: tRNA (adenosine(37)-N6)-threonylcarbamoyltransferase complex dimerization subunit type 1 TsaB [Tenericutes bacterium GWC2_34_14]OHE32918.1 MAG: tRNA (adenosine(37)-N6)-threonylcarbamoyltransferase complex dimerization subunit type 1 TsaB [Tenericutes bacterium GWE2_34_108]OHE36117.1 MAG: tRNA (adenosine(37)-N6)-threonylcarbamoyltransferase complex dimerization subunit type 1 TsaB [Tenericutes bacterium GWF1_35_14]OHE39340.1 MAG: tRNA (adenosine(37)-N6)-threonylcarbamoyltransferase comple
MRTLFFDVSTNVMYVGLAKDDILIDYSIRIAIRDHAKYLVDRIDQILKRNKLTLDKIDELIIGYGPGSYTGIRIAVVVGKMLAYAKHVKLKVISSLFFMTSGYEGKVAALIDARRGFVFSAIYEDGKVILEDGYRKLAELQENKLYQKAQTVFIDDRSYIVNPKRLREHSILVEDIHGLVPQYLRITEAEHNEHQKSTT